MLFHDHVLVHYGAQIAGEEGQEQQEGYEIPALHALDEVGAHRGPHQVQ